jgi:hypothetical protein
VGPGEEEPPDGGPTEPPTGSVDEQIAEHLASAAEHYRLADAALAEGDLGTYQQQVELARLDLEAAAQLLIESGVDVPTASPTPTVPEA